MSKNMGASQATGLAGAEALEPHAGLHPSDGIPSAGLVRLLRALAHDCENTDGWEGAAGDVHAAADLILTLETRITTVRQWASGDYFTDADETWDDGWDTGYSAAARAVERMLNRDSDGTATAAANEDLPVPQDCQARAESIAQPEQQP